MPFPNVTRVLYDRNPLDQVICQLRFPPILKIDSEIPAHFQDKVRDDFPNFNESSEIKIEMPKGMQEKIPPEIIKQVLPPGNKNYEFSSEDRLWKINLTRSFLSLSASKYERWEKFKEKLNIPLNTLIEIYSPKYFSRIGLRYIDIIRRSNLKLDDVNWIELLKNHILGILGSSDVGKYVENFESRDEIRLSDGESMVRIITRFVDPADSNEKCYMIDSDFFIGGNNDIAKVRDKLDYFNKRASRLIQWCITNKLHQAMGPKAI